jgi:hypothetical protein
MDTKQLTSSSGFDFLGSDTSENLPRILLKLKLGTKLLILCQRQVTQDQRDS